MQPSHAASRRARPDHCNRRFFPLVAASLLFVGSIPVLVSCQRGSRSTQWGNARVFRSGANSHSSGQVRLYDELHRDPGEPNSTNQRSTQQVDAMQTPNPPPVAYSSGFSQSRQQVWPTVVPSVSLSSTPVFPRTPTTAEANSYSFRGSAARADLSSFAPTTHTRPSSRSTGATEVGLGAPQPEAEAPYDSVTSIPSFNGIPTFRGNSAPGLAREGTPHTTIAPSYPVSVARSGTENQRLYGEYTERTTGASDTETRSASALASSPSAWSDDNTGTQSSFPPMEFSSRDISEVNGLAPFGSAFHASQETPTVTPWGSATQGCSETLVNGLGDISRPRTSTTFESNNVEATTSERQRTVATPQSTLSLPHQRLWTTDSSDGTQTSENDRSSNALSHALATPSRNPAYVVYTGLKPHQGERYERPSVMPGTATITTEPSGSVAPTSDLTAALDDNRHYEEQPGLGVVRGNVTLSTSIERDSASSSARVYERVFQNDEGSNAMSANNSSFSLFEANPIDQFSLQHENKTWPHDMPFANTFTQEPNNYISGPSESRDEGSPTLFARESQDNHAEEHTSGNNPLAPPCQLFQGDALLRTDNSSEDRCIDFGASHRLEPTAVPPSMPSLTQEVSPATEQLSAESRHEQIPAENVVKDHIQNGSAKVLSSNYASLATEANANEPRAASIAAEDGKPDSSIGSPENAASRNIRVGYIPPDALTASLSRAGGRDVKSNTDNKEQLLYGALGDYKVDAKDPFVKSLAAVESHENGEGNLSVTTTTTATTQTYPPFYNPYNDNLDVDDIPDSPYHNYKWAVDPFPSTYSTHSRLENYESEFNNRYYHEEKTAPNITWEEYTRRRSEVDDARKREAEFQNEGKIGLIEGSDSQFQGLIGYPNRRSMSRLPR